MSIIARDAKDLASLFEAVLAITKGWQKSPSDAQEIWFRGQPKAAYNLVPSLYRPDDVALKEMEDSLINRFKNRGLAYANFVSGGEQEWDWYLLARHYGIPTRLLDWTEALLTAVFFALDEEIHRIDRALFSETLSKSRSTPLFDKNSPVIWVLDAGSLNFHSIRKDYALTLGGDATKNFLPPLEQSIENRFPIAIHARHSNLRVAAQQGAFTLHGSDTDSIDSLAQNDDRIQLALIRLDRANICHIWNELEIAGVNYMTIFPGLESIAKCTTCCYK